MIQSLLFWEVLFGAVVGYWLLPPRLRDGFLFFVSAGYLATLAPWSVAGLIGLTALFKLLSPRLVGETRTAERILVVSVLAVSASLAFFKFAPPILTALHGSRVESMVLVPLGISYYSFKLIHYAVEVARENIEPAPWDTFLAYMFLFPTFTAGPIERYDHLLAHRESRLSRDMVVEGGTRIVIGLIKTGFVSELVRQVMSLGIPNNAFLLDHLATTSTPQVWLVILRTYLLVYLGFSGYTDVAIGASRLFGIGIMENFNFPIFARSISEYWSRWHMSLSRWCQAYVYMPTLARARSPYLALNA
ncbi:MBOAT family O-acyltransferase [Sphingomonas aerophila]|uniref:Alginate O-acetyltransferase complex protein AlgI n=1 Tax=Sphingomonas aerophila TaxID=1344948 RepID=A0A7W9BBT2_9SPHN|nr:MBOAT family O-acyltransferase [Sphingomonas aerophila]MBB5714324.1 alginate O-acetyltransferase complex protein AlgI [Sphingomonas aerophila]